MKKVAVFGNAGGGKSTLSRNLAQLTGLPWVPIDSLQYKPGGEMVSPEQFKAAHIDLMYQDFWIADGFGTMKTVWERLEVADTLVYLDMPILQHTWWITKRLLKGLWVSPLGWPENSPLLKGTFNSYRNMWLCHTKLTPRYRDYVSQVQATKQVFHLRSCHEIAQFYQAIAAQTDVNCPKNQP